MSLIDCASLGYVYGTSFCLPVNIDVPQHGVELNTLWFTPVCVLGGIIGVFIIVPLTNWHLAAWKKKKTHERHVERSQNADTRKVFPTVEFLRRNKDSVGQKKKNDASASDVDPSLVQGMVDIMIQTSKSESEIVMTEQDIAAVKSMERSIEEEKSALMIKVLNILLRKKMEKRSITNSYYYNFMKKTKEEIEGIDKMINRQREEDEEKLRVNQKLNKDTQMLETEFQKLQTHYSNKQSQLQRDFRNKIRQDLLRSSGMSEKEVNNIMTKLINNMAIVEEKIGMEQARQKRALNQRLARRQQLLEQMEMEDEDKEQIMEKRVETFRNIIAAHMKRDHKIDRYSDDVMNEFAEGVNGIRKYHAKEYSKLSKKKYDYLAKSRLASISDLAKKQEMERKELLQTEGQTINTMDIIKGYHDLRTEHHKESEALCEELDRNDFKEMHNLKQDIAKKEIKDIETEAEKIAKKLINGSNMMSSEVERIFQLHKSEMEEYNAKKQNEKQAMLAQLQEQLQKRLDAADDNEAQDQKEQDMLKVEQMATLTKVLATNMDLTEEDKERVMKEYEQNMKVLSNKLLCSKLLQQKSLEIKLQQRKGRLEKLQLEKKNIEKSNVLKEKEKKKRTNRLSRDIAEEERLLNEARQIADSELRQQQAKEIEEALKQQDQEISLLIGRLQVSKARRQVVLEKKNANLMLLQNELETRFASGDTLPLTQIDMILQKHKSHVEHLLKEMQLRKKREENIIKERLNAKKRDCEQDTEAELEECDRSNSTEQQRRAAGFASMAFVNLLSEQRHAKAMQELSTEMYVEFEKLKSDLNSKLTMELQEQLEVQKKELLTQLAAVSKMPNADLQSAISTVHEGNTTNRGAQQQAVDLQNSVARARTPVADAI